MGKYTVYEEIDIIRIFEENQNFSYESTAGYYRFRLCSIICNLKSLYLQYEAKRNTKVTIAINY